MDVPHPLPVPLATMIAERFRVLSDPMRIRLLDLLREGPATVHQLTDATGGSQQNVSKHLGVLHRSGLLVRTREGNFVRYGIADESIFALCELVCGGLQRQLEEQRSILSPVAS